MGSEFWCTPTRGSTALEPEIFPTNTPPGVSIGILVLAGARWVLRSRSQMVHSAGLAGWLGWAGWAGLQSAACSVPEDSVPFGRGPAGCGAAANKLNIFAGKPMVAGALSQAHAASPWCVVKAKILI